MATDMVDATQPVSLEATIRYPESDGEPMGETDFHITVILYLRQALRRVFRRADQIYVAANMFFYYEEGNPNARRAPDVFVVKGVSKHDRRVYKLWEEKATPCAVFEITSKSTRLEDFGDKKALYEMLGVQEYFLFDPLQEYISSQLQGFRLVEGYYQPMTLSAEKTLFSRELNLLLKPEETMLRVIEPETGELIPTLDEAIEQTDAAVEQAKAELQRADAEAQRADAEAQRADAAEAKADRLEAELERLRRQLGRD